MVNIPSGVRQLNGCASQLIAAWDNEKNGKCGTVDNDETILPMMLLQSSCCQHFVFVTLHTIVCSLQESQLLVTLFYELAMPYQICN